MSLEVVDENNVDAAQASDKKTSLEKLTEGWPRHELGNTLEEFDWEILQRCHDAECPGVLGECLRYSRVLDFVIKKLNKFGQALFFSVQVNTRPKVDDKREKKAN